MNKEVKTEVLKEIPFNIYKSMGEISYSRPEFLSRVKQKFIAKQELLRKYH
jgi:hypothetical protein